jgi:tight adherence protein C
VRPTGWLVAATALLYVGGWLAVSGWIPERPSVDQAVGRLRRSGPNRRVSTDVGLVSRVGSTVQLRVGPRTDGWTRPLRLIGRPLEHHLGLLVVAALGGLVLPSLVAGVLRVAGVVSVGVWVPAVLSLATAIAVPVALHGAAITRSEKITLDLRHQLGAYLDMVTMLLAGNTGHEGALEQAARAGDGLLFQQLRRRMREVSTTGQSLVRALDMVADDYGLVELEQVAATTTLSANEGAPVARTLGAKCATLRSALAADQEAAARVRTDKVTPPLVGMALLFMALIIYPALDLT